MRLRLRLHHHHPLRYLALWCVIVVAAAAVVSSDTGSGSSGERRRRPHILLFLADDWGYNDVSWGELSQVPTPQLARLRQESVELMQFYTQPKCTASRAALMTGRYPYKMGLQTKNVFNRVKNNTLDTKYKLLPAYLRDLGYATHMAGKWHLGHCNVNATPIGRGFDTHFGSWANLDDRFDLTAGDAFDWNWNNEPYWPARGTHTTELITNHTQHMLTAHFAHNATRDQPLFMYVSYLVPHKPPEFLERYVRSTNCSSIPETIPDPEDETKTIPNIRRPYCGLVAAMDESIGNITQTLRDLNVIDDFIIVVASDNGGAMGAGASNYPLRGSKQSVYEGGTRVRALLRAPGYLDEGHSTGQYDGLFHLTDMLPTLLSAANGTTSVLPRDIDGLDAWENIRTGSQTKRKWMVYNIDSSRKVGAIRYKGKQLDFKLIFSNQSFSETGYRYLDPRPQSEQVLHPRQRFYPKNDQAYFLYDLSSNPNEVPASDNHSDYPDAAASNPKMFNRLKRKLLKEMRKEVDILRFGPLNKNEGHTRNGAWRVAGC